VTRLSALLAACGGFLLAVLWFDLMFDVQVLGHAAAPAPLPDETLASIAHYYARVTRGAYPMHLLVALVMATTVLGSLWHVGRMPREPRTWLACLLAVTPIGLAVLRVFPNAAQLGMRVGTLGEQSALARGIFADHVFCWLAMAAFTALQIVAFSRSASHAHPAPPAAVPR
jgi:hypothetical protein